MIIFLFFQAKAHFLQNNDSYWREEKIEGAYEKDSGVQLCEEVGEIDRRVSERLFREEIRIVKEEIIASFKKEIDRLIINLYLDDYSLREIRENVHLDYRHIQYIVKRFQKAFVKNMKKRNYN